MIHFINLVHSFAPLLKSLLNPVNCCISLHISLHFSSDKCSIDCSFSSS